MSPSFKIEANRLVVTCDLDGTLLEPDGSVSRSTLRVLEQFRERGGLFIAATGRPPSSLSVLSPLGLSTPAVSANGAAIFEAGIRSRPTVRRISRATLTAVIIQLEDARQNVWLAVELDDVMLMERGFRTGVGKWRSTHPVNRTEIAQLDALKLLVQFRAGSSSITLSRAGAILASHLSVTRSGPGLGELECTARNVNKSSGLRKVLSFLRASDRPTLAFGDMPNDLDMLKDASFGVAVANAHVSVIEVADDVSGSNVDDGVARYLSSVCGLRSAFQ